MKCAKIKRKEAWENHIEKLDPVCATNTGKAKRAAHNAGKAKALLVLNNAKASLARRIQCEGTCQEGWKCVQPGTSDVKATDTSLDIEVKLVAPQPDPNPCKGREKQYSAQAVIGFTITATCKCEKKGDEDPSLFRMEPPPKVQKKRSRK